MKINKVESEDTIGFCFAILLVSFWYFYVKLGINLISIQLKFCFADMPRTGVSRAHLSSHDDEDDGPEVVIQPSPAKPRRSLKNKTLKVRHKLMEVDDHGL